VKASESVADGFENQQDSWHRSNCSRIMFLVCRVRRCRNRSLVGVFDSPDNGDGGLAGVHLGAAKLSLSAS